jgi:hypothetical protein
MYVETPKPLKSSVIAVDLQRHSSLTLEHHSSQQDTLTMTEKRKVGRPKGTNKEKNTLRLGLSASKKSSAHTVNVDSSDSTGGDSTRIYPTVLRDFNVTFSEHEQAARRPNSVHGSQKGKEPVAALIDESDRKKIIYSERCIFDKEDSKSVLRVLALDARNLVDTWYVSSAFNFLKCPCAIRQLGFSKFIFDYPIS